ncbi:hypothetical protein AK830_g4246 [Neonectria ditissima]|uniref:Uncharacterized protein n=1 Tax=Neonectria ditissima TaxID=78410 RepID=A0A0P7AWD9_9HYPO|nr:hypothetical protein AK830_g4246 [Neonectria ditissima]
MNRATCSARSREEASTSASLLNSESRHPILGTAIAGWSEYRSCAEFPGQMRRLMQRSRPRKPNTLLPILSIPVPEIHAYSFVQDSPVRMAFIIMDLIQGKNLIELGFKSDHDAWISGTWEPTKSRKAMYAALAKFYIQMRRLEFPEISALGLPTTDDDSIRVRHRPLCVEMLIQEIEGLEPTRIFPKGRTLATAREYVGALFALSENLFEKTRNSRIDEQGGARTLYARDGFKRFVTDNMFPPESAAAVSKRSLGEDAAVVSGLGWHRPEHLPDEFQVGWVVVLIPGPRLSMGSRRRFHVEGRADTWSWLGPDVGCAEADMLYDRLSGFSDRTSCPFGGFHSLGNTVTQEHGITNTVTRQPVTQQYSNTVTRQPVTQQYSNTAAIDKDGHPQPQVWHTLR